jgi:hypothetical protein
MSNKERLPRSILLPEFFKSYPHWMEFADAIDEAMEGFDLSCTSLARVREVIHLSDEAKISILNGSVVEESALDHFDRETMCRTLTLLGCPIRDFTIFTDDQLFRILQHLPTYWYSKGGPEVGEFLSFVLGVDISLTQMWTEDYVHFLPDQDPSVGRKIYEGGTWYPTSHVQLGVNPFLSRGLTPAQIRSFLDDLLNYNLVVSHLESRSMHAVVQLSDPVVPTSEFSGSRSLALSSFTVNTLVIPNDPEIVADVLLLGGSGPPATPPIDPTLESCFEVVLTLGHPSRTAVGRVTSPSSWSLADSAQSVNIRVTNISSETQYLVYVPHVVLTNDFVGMLPEQSLPATVVPEIPPGGYVDILSEELFFYLNEGYEEHTLPVVIPAGWISTESNPYRTNTGSSVYSFQIVRKSPDPVCDPFFHEVIHLLRMKEEVGASVLYNEAPGSVPDVALPVNLSKNHLDSVVFSGFSLTPIKLDFPVNSEPWSLELLIRVDSFPKNRSAYGLVYTGVNEDFVLSEERIQLSVTSSGRVVLLMSDGAHRMYIENQNPLSTVSVNHVLLEKNATSWWLTVNGVRTPEFTKQLPELRPFFWIGAGFSHLPNGSLPLSFKGGLVGVRTTTTLRSTARISFVQSFAAIDCTN